MGNSHLLWSNLKAVGITITDIAVDRKHLKISFSSELVIKKAESYFFVTIDFFSSVEASPNPVNDRTDFFK